MRGGGKQEPTGSWNRASAGEHKDFGPSPHGKLKRLICGLEPRQLCRGMPLDGFFHSLICREFLPAEKCSRAAPPLPCLGFLLCSAHPSLLAPRTGCSHGLQTQMQARKKVPSTHLHSQKQLSPETTVQHVQIQKVLLNALLFPISGLVKNLLLD